MKEFYKEAKASETLEYGIHFFRQSTPSRTVSAHPHIHDSLELIYVKEGSYAVACDNSEAQVKVGDLILFRSGCIHSAEAMSEKINSYYVLKIEPSLLFSLMPERNAGKYAMHFALFSESTKFVWSADELKDTEIPSAFARLAREMDGRELPAHDASMRAGAFTVISALLRKLELKSAYDSTLAAPLYTQIYKSMKYVSEHFSDDVSAEWMASYLNISYSYFSRSFSRITGTNFRKYLNLVRIRRAEQLLLEGNKTVTEVSSLVGFNSVSHFIATYKSIKGQTPHKMRK